MPQTRYNVFEKGNSEPLTQCSDMHEADIVIQQLKDANPHKEYIVEPVVVYDSDAFRYGRDPELH
tara:strand:- start:15255 stop:15449 length:195 start_codon:yes stop_codon:yes gene_type:complete